MRVQDLNRRKLLPHSKKEVKFDTDEPLSTINEICEIKSCNNCIFFEVRKKMDCYMWLSKAPQGPSVRFHVSNVQTMAELRYVGNCLMGSRPIVVFDKSFDDEQQPHFGLVKEMLLQVSSTFILIYKKRLLEHQGVIQTVNHLLTILFVFLFKITAFGLETIRLF